MKINIRKIFLIIFILLITICINNLSFATDEPELNSQAAILIDQSTGKILFEKNSEEKMYPASTTKILTAILTIENCELDEVVTVNYDAISTIPSGYATADLKAEEQLTIKQLLDVLLVHSANDAANVLAMHVGGSIESFVTMMNSKAQELGCTNTNFTNAYGLQDENHYTTAKDLSRIAQYCMENSTFRSFVSQPQCTITATNKHDARYFTNTNDLLRPSSKYYYEYAIGVKTGYTKEAKNCLIASSKKNGLELLSVILGADGLESGSSHRYDDTTSLFEYGYSNYSMQKIASANDIVSNITVSNATQETKNLELALTDDINCLISNNSNIENIEPVINLEKTITAPLATGTVVGTATYTIDGEKYTSKIIATHDVEKSTFWLLIIRIILITLIIITLISLLIPKKKKKYLKY
jgi:D-alanyl-D-alanine carboxypeptidase (penicillin-binding protein 5/6)